MSCMNKSSGNVARSVFKIWKCMSRTLFDIYIARNWYKFIQKRAHNSSSCTSLICIFTWQTFNIKAVRIEDLPNLVWWTLNMRNGAPISQMYNSSWLLHHHPSSKLKPGWLFSILVQQLTHFWKLLRTKLWSNGNLLSLYFGTIHPIPERVLGQYTLEIQNICQSSGRRGRRSLPWNCPFQ